MRAMVCDEFGGPEQFREREMDRPPIGPNSVLVRLTHAGVNPGDARIRQGQFVPRARHHFPMVLGLEGAGFVEEIGLSGSPFELGQAVYGFFLHDYVGDGTYAELAPTRSTQLAPVPPGIPMREAAAVACAGGTAMVLVEELLQVGPGDTVVVLGAAGGVGHFAVQVAVASGAEVIGVARSSNHEFVRGLGAAHVVDYRTEDVSAAVAKLAPKGVDAAVDTVGGAAQAQLSDMVRHGGRVASCVHAAETPEFVARHQSFEYRFFEATPSRMQRLNEHVASRRVRPRITRELPLSSVAEGHRAIDAGEVRGKIVLRIDDAS
ncbi:NADP-dependent oxidoreductase [Streptomyces scopuliridis]|uniref:NADP-dependent oxidoreductase n=1 Tax=Streptomyces scopuliridis TaxID=452529 RepID=UPI002DDC571C|nr:NADP-dependent oxidoreductase [Streptomyces scopuliridis]WSB35349.1 NADP-dependent oxidoreductase [Streptomyces scopuliridis]